MINELNEDAYEHIFGELEREKENAEFAEDRWERFSSIETHFDDIDLVADITHYCIKGLEVPFIYGRLGHGLTEESSKPLVAKVVYGALGKKVQG